MIACGCGATLKFTTRSHRFDGDGEVFGIKGSGETPQIRIAADIAFVNRLDVEGVRGIVTITGLTGGTENGRLLN